MLNIFSKKTESSNLNKSLEDSSKYYSFYISLTCQQYLTYCYRFCKNWKKEYMEVNNRDKIDLYKNLMEEEVQFDCPYIKIGKNSGQEGRHRMKAAEELYGAEASFEILIIIDRELKVLLGEIEDENILQKIMTIFYDGTPQSK